MMRQIGAKTAGVPGECTVSAQRSTALPCGMSPVLSAPAEGDAQRMGFAHQNVPHIFFLSCQKENVPDTVQKKKR